MIFKRFLFCLPLITLATLNAQPAAVRKHKIVGGFVAPIETAPYQVSLLYKLSHTCGGSILSPSFVLTACHCTVRKRAIDFSIRAGSNETQVGGDVVQVLEIYNHPLFNEYTYDHDFALLKLIDELYLDGVRKKAVDLPQQDTPLPSGIQVIISGWGETLNFMESNQFLRAVIVGVMDYATCRNFYMFDGGITYTQFCAGIVEGGKGGPLVAVGTNLLYGVTSWGIGCAQPFLPGVYVRTSAVRNWIDGIIRQ